MSRRTPFVATLVALPLALAGCGAGPAIVGLHPAPAEGSAGASLSDSSAAQVTTRVLEDAAEARDKGGKASSEDLEAVFAGPALRAAKAAAESKDDSDHSSGDPKDLQVLGVSRGTDWPRAVLATSQEEGVQFLHVLVASEAGDSYRLFADVPMAAGASVPALTPVAEGAPVTVSSDLGKEVSAAVEDWAKGVAFPAPDSVPSSVSFGDAYSTALKKNAKARNKDLDKLASYRQRQSVIDDSAASFELADGAHLSFVPIMRTDSIKAGRKLKELKVQDPAIRQLLGASKVKKTLTVKHAETVAFVTPAEGKAQVVGVGDVLHSVSGR